MVSIGFLDPENMEIDPGIIFLAALVMELWAKIALDGGHLEIQYGRHGMRLKRAPLDSSNLKIWG